ncbi:hypothetical protein SAMN05661099_2433 [Daejeonella lutea]|uniref:Uncharacterized protein n=1 Tax=Daejeonella lutea TaxID=572036 RepID=A0A1T5DM42_9SPHI|nr:hypothetical protein SAMN05661099_2433 [Daejeonella lutea]
MKTILHTAKDRGIHDNGRLEATHFILLLIIMILLKCLSDFCASVK